MKSVLLLMVRAYRLLLSPWLGAGCRFEPSCSLYAMHALAQHGAWAGSYLTLRRLSRCHPACAGGCDPVPPVSAQAGLFRRLFPSPSKTTT